MRTVAESEHGLERDVLGMSEVGSLLRAVCMPLLRLIGGGSFEREPAFAVPLAKVFVTLCLLLLATALLVPSDEFWRGLPGGRGDYLALVLRNGSVATLFPPPPPHRLVTRSKHRIGKRPAHKRGKLSDHDIACAAFDADPARCAATSWPDNGRCEHVAGKCRTWQWWQQHRAESGRGRMLRAESDWQGRRSAPPQSQIERNIMQVGRVERSRHACPTGGEQCAATAQTHLRAGAVPRAADAPGGKLVAEQRAAGWILLAA